MPLVREESSQPPTRLSSCARGVACPAPWKLFLLCGVVLCGLYAVPAGKSYYDSLSFVIIALALFALIWGVRLNRPAYVLPWYFLIAGSLSLVTGGGLWLYAEAFPSGTNLIANLSNLCYLAFYPFAAIAIVLFFYRSSNGRGWPYLFDALILATGAGLCLWATVMDRYWDNVSLAPLDKLMAIAFPAGDLLLLAAALCLLLLPHIRSGAYVLLIAALVIELTTDLLYSIMTLQGQYQTGQITGFGWLAAYTLMGAAALHPEMESLTKVRNVPAPQLSGWRVVLLLASGAVGPALYALKLQWGVHVDVEVVVAGSLVLFLLVLARMVHLNHQLSNRELSFRQLFAANPHPMWVYRVDDLRIVEANDAAMSQYGYSRDEFLSRQLPDLRPASERTQFLQHSVKSMPPYQPLRPFRHQRRDGSIFEVEVASHALDFQGVAMRLAVAQDITERATLERELEHRAFHDVMTGLPNRGLFFDRLHQAQQRAARDQRPLAVLFVDLDHFKDVNDSFGHEAGDQLLVNVAHRLEGIFNATETVARFGGDEFTVLLGELRSAGEAEQIAARITELFQVPFVIEGHERVITASVGIILSPQGQDSPADLLRFADIALYRAKAGGRNRYAVFDTTMCASALSRATLERELAHAIEADELCLHYQPKVALSTGRPLGIEALVRWQHPERGLIPPDAFIPLAEDTGLVVPLGTWVLREACRQLKEWQSINPAMRELRIGVNLSMRQIEDARFLDLVRDTLAETGLPASNLQLEVTESMLAHDTARTIETLTRLRALGIQVAIDDFGTGYSSLSYLTHFPVDTVKIDQGFVQALNNRTDNAAIIQAIVSLAQTFSLEVVAEGIETIEDQARLAALGCTVGQGYLFSHPLAAASVPQWLADRLGNDPQAEPSSRERSPRGAPTAPILAQPWSSL
jgi:diguanylate cyclase (GGDEF)-like protein/PAS domain S-box-containing protein